MDVHEQRKILATLSICTAFADLSAEVLSLITASASIDIVQSGETFIQQGDAGDSLMILMSGAAVVLLDASGKAQRIAHFEPGDVIGEMSLVTQQPRSADVQATTRCELLVLRAEEFHRIANRAPELGVVLTNIISERLGAGVRDGMGDKLIEGYRIEAPIGQGATSVVYRATEVDTGRTVALKMMTHRMRYEVGAAARFEREAKILLALRHENIACVHRLLRAYETRFLVMDYCNGQGLEWWIPERGGFSEEGARTILGNVARALMYLHESGVVHRDLKPSNVMLADGGQVKLVDFGLAKVLRPETTLTVAGVLVGTPRYMSPEQLKGNEAGEADDYYAFGCLAYELVAGRPLFQAPTFFELVEEKCNHEMAPYDAVGSGVTPEFAAVLSGTLGFDSERRFQAFESALEW